MGLTPDQITACLVTRGDVDMTPILDNLPYGEVLIWDNSKREDLGPYGRYELIKDASNEVIYMQDDDTLCLCHDRLMREYEPGTMTVNYHEPWDIAWHGRGGLFHRDLPAQIFAEYHEVYPDDWEFRRWLCDGIFSLLVPLKVFEDAYEDLPWGFAPGRMSTGPNWYDHYRPMILERAQVLRERRLVTA